MGRGFRDFVLLTEVSGDFWSGFGWPVVYGSGSRSRKDKEKLKSGSSRIWWAFAGFSDSG